MIQRAGSLDGMTQSELGFYLLDNRNLQVALGNQRYRPRLRSFVGLLVSCAFLTYLIAQKFWEAVVSGQDIVVIIIMFCFLALITTGSLQMIIRDVLLWRGGKVIEGIVLSAHGQYRQRRGHRFYTLLVKYSFLLNGIEYNGEDIIQAEKYQDVPVPAPGTPLRVLATPRFRLAL